MTEQKPRPGWIYMINPKRVVLRCRRGHEHVYDISGPEELNCSEESCVLKINSSRVIRGLHPHIVWSEFIVDKLHFYLVIPLTSKDTFRGLPTSYPIKANLQNGLNHTSITLVHQLTTVDAECFKEPNGTWMKRLGVISADEKKDIEARLMLALNLPNSPSEDWFTQNASTELLEKIFMLMDTSQREGAISRLLNKLDC